MAKVPAGGKVAGYLLPFFLRFGAVDHLVPVFFSYVMAPQTSRTIRPMLLPDTRKPCIRILKLMPVARYLRVMASFNPGVKARLKLESLFSSLGVNLASSSWNMAGSILSMFLNSLGSSFSSSTLRFSHQPNCSRRLS